MDYKKFDNEIENYWWTYSFLIELSLSRLLYRVLLWKVFVFQTH